MNESDKNNETKKTVANEIVTVFRKVKISIILGFVWFAGFSIYNGLIQYSLFDKQFAWFEAEEILGYKPSQYNFVVDKVERKSEVINNTTAEDNKLLDSIADTEEFKEWNKKNGNIAENNALDNEIHSGSMEISDTGYGEVKKEIINKLVEDSFIFTLIMISVIFGILMLFHYINRGIKWTNKYAD